MHRWQAASEGIVASSRKSIRDRAVSERGYLARTSHLHMLTSFFKTRIITLYVNTILEGYVGHAVVLLLTL